MVCLPLPALFVAVRVGDQRHVSVRVEVEVPARVAPVKCRKSVAPQVARVIGRIVRYLPAHLVSIPDVRRLLRTYRF